MRFERAEALHLADYLGEADVSISGSKPLRRDATVGEGDPASPEGVTAGGRDPALARGGVTVASTPGGATRRPGLVVVALLTAAVAFLLALRR